MSRVASAPALWLLALVLLILARPAQAQLLDDVELRREGGDAVLQLRFVTGVQLVRTVQASSGDQTIVFYRVLPSQVLPNPLAAERLLPAREGEAAQSLPAIRVLDEAGPTRMAGERRVLLRFAQPVKHRVRAGRGDRVIDVVLEGRGAAVAPAAAAVARVPVPRAPLPAVLPPAAPPPAPSPAVAPPEERAGYRVTLEAHEGASPGLSAPVPAALQNLDLFTTRRIVDGRVIHETHLGPFATRAQAEAALAQLRGRFPLAAVTSPDAPAALPGAPVQAAAPSVPPVPAPAVPARPPAPAVVAQAPAAPASPPAAAPAASAPAPTPAPVPGQVPAPAVRPAAPVVPPAVAAAPVAPAADGDLAARAAVLMSRAREAMVRSEGPAAIEALQAVLELPANPASREAQALIGQARLMAGDSGRARAEFEQFLRQYPQGEDADRVRGALAAMTPGEPVATTETPGRRRITPTTTLTGSVSAYYYGGQSKVRTQEFQDSPLSGLPELVSDATLSNTDQRQWVTSADVNWRHRDADIDQRFVFRDSYTRDELRPEKSRNRLSALYYDQRSFVNGTSFRVGRQSPLGGGVLGRFDGAQLGYAFRPRWKASVVAGAPTDTLLDARRYFYGGAIEAEALTQQLGGSLYAIEQKIDGEIDRRAVGTELRFFDGGLSGTAQLDYDALLKGLNIASLQGTWQRADNTVINFLYDRRSTPMLMLGNTLFFTDPNLPVRPTRLSDLLALTPIEDLRARAKQITARSTQAALGFTTPFAPGWQVGMDVRYTNTGAVAPVPDILPSGLPSTGDIWSLSGQLIGTNLYSARDTHVFIVNVLNGPTYTGQLVSYNNSSVLGAGWQLEPSLKWYRQSEASGIESTRWAPGLRVTYRLLQQFALESEVSVENSKTTGPNRNESSSRTFYYLGGRYEF